MYMNTNTTTDNGLLLRKELEHVLENHQGKSDSVASFLAGLLNDMKNLAYYKILVAHTNPAFLIEIAHDVKARDLEGKIRTTRAVYFMAILKRKQIQTKFKGEKHGQS